MSRQVNLGRDKEAKLEAVKHLTGLKSDAAALGYILEDYLKSNRHPREALAREIGELRERYHRQLRPGEQAVLNHLPALLKGGLKSKLAILDLLRSDLNKAALKDSKQKPLFQVVEE